MSDLLGIAHVSSDRIRDALFETPSYDKNEQAIVLQMMLMMSEEYLRHGLSVIFDISLNRVAERRALREIAKKNGASPVFIWLQIDQQTALFRSKVRDRRKSDDKFSHPLTDAQFDYLISSFQPPQSEDYIVLSGKHTFEAQKGTLIRRFRELGIIDDETMRPHVAKPEMMNLAAQASAQAGRVDLSRRNITIR